MYGTRSLATRLAALGIVGVLMAACGTTPEDRADMPSDAPTQPADGSDGDSGATDPDERPTDPSPEEPSPDDPASEDEGDAATPTLTVGFDARKLEVLSPDGSPTWGWEIPAGTNETFWTVAVRPGATDTDMDAIVAVLRGEVPRLYHLRVVGGTDGSFTELPDHLQPQDELESVITLAWSPDGRSVLWTEPTTEGVTLRTFGWEDGPGTGRTADDNAAFALELPADVAIDGFRVETEDRWTLLLTDGIGLQHELTIARQADGALALL